MDCWVDFSYSVALALLACFNLQVGLAMYRATLDPLYGSVPSNLRLPYIFKACAMAAATTPIDIAIRVTELPYFIPPFLLALPRLAHFLATRTSRMGDPHWGPLVTHVVLLLPFAYTCITSVIVHVRHAWITAIQHGIRRNPPSIPSTALRIMSLSFWTIAFPKLLRQVQPNDPIQLQIAAVLSLLAGMRSLRMGRMLSVHKLSILTTIAMLFSHAVFDILRSTTLSHPLDTPYTHPTSQLRVLSSTQSTIGIVVVGELPIAGPIAAGVHSLRYLRASHSLLGGVWIGDQITSAVTFDTEGNALGDSVYTAFVLQEAARLFTPQGSPVEAQPNALIIGLGTGIAAAAFMRHNLTTTVVEIDHAVFSAATKYFGLPALPPEQVFLEDARAWLRSRLALFGLSSASTVSARDQANLYGIVVHDCFSGGLVPAHLFTVEFWRDLRTVMTPDGVLAVNYAGKLGSRPFRAVFRTLEEVFGPCRAFHDSLESITYAQLRESFANIVFFCTTSNSPNLPDHRPADDADFLNSRLRHAILSSLSAREIDLSLMRRNAFDAQEVLSDLWNPLEGWQEAEALDHWKLMRQILPDVLWETY